MCPDYYISLHAFIWLFFAYLSANFSYLLLTISFRFLKMYTAARKIQKDKDSEPTEFEESVAQVIVVVVFIFSFIISLFQIYSWYSFASDILQFMGYIIYILPFLCFLAGILWFGEYQPRNQEWLEGSIHKFCSVRMIYEMYVFKKELSLAII